MDFLLNIFDTFLNKPLLNALVLLYEYIPGRDFGVAVIALTLLIRFVFYPLSAKSAKMQKKISEIQPKLKELQKKYKDNRTQQAQAVMELYRKEGINPFAPLVPLLIQLPVFLALYHLFLNNFENGALDKLYSFVPNPETIDPSFLGLVNLQEQSIVLALAAGIIQFFQIKQTMPKASSEEKKEKKEKKEAPDFATVFRKQMLFIFPIMIVIIGSQLPSALALYWGVTSLFLVIQYWIINRKDKESPTKEQSVTV